MKRQRLFLFMAGLGMLIHGSLPGRGMTVEEDLRAGKGFLSVRVYSLEEDQEVLRLFSGLRVADVSDGLDKAGLPGIGLVDPAILPLWTDADHFSHRIVGIAVTARYVPTQKPFAGKMPPAEFDAWEGEFYTKYSSEPFADLVRPGTILVIDDVESPSLREKSGYWGRRIR